MFLKFSCNAATEHLLKRETMNVILYWIVSTNPHIFDLTTAAIVVVFSAITVSLWPVTIHSLFRGSESLRLWIL
jgi:hypothetical protein